MADERGQIDSPEHGRAARWRAARRPRRDRLARHDPLAAARLRRASSALWTAASRRACVYLQVVDHADLMARADRQQMRTFNPPAKRGEIVDRNGRVLAYSVDADTIAAVPDRNRRSRRRRRRRSAARSTAATADSGRRSPRSCRARRRSPTSRARCRPTRPSASAALALTGITLLQGEPPLLSEQGAGGARPRLRRPRQRRARRDRVHLRLADPRQATARC